MRMEKRSRILILVDLIILFNIELEKRIGILVSFQESFSYTKAFGLYLTRDGLAQKFLPGNEPNEGLQKD